jgi:hypothetical protein
MGYRIRMVAEVAGWLGRLREADPGTAGLVERDQGGTG